MRTASGIASKRAASSVRRAASRRHSETPALNGGISTRTIADFWMCSGIEASLWRWILAAYASSARSRASQAVWPDDTLGMRNSAPTASFIALMAASSQSAAVWWSKGERSVWRARSSEASDWAADRVSYRVGAVDG